MIHFQAWKKFVLTNIVLLHLIQLRLRHAMNLKMTQNLSFVKVVYIVDKKMAQNGRKMAIYE